jgi:hypothetical protein
MIVPVGSPELELEIAIDTGPICQSDRVEKTGLRPIWRSERDSNAQYSIARRADPRPKGFLRRRPGGRRVRAGCTNTAQPCGS